MPPELVERLLAGAGDDGTDRAHCSSAGLEPFEPLFRLLLDTLESGVGFVILDNLYPAGLTPFQVRRLVLSMSNCVGRIIAQDRRGTLLADIVDTSEDEASSVSRFTDLPFHADNAWGKIFPDYMGLMCLQPARVGGDLQLISGFAVLGELERLDDDFVQCLQEPFRYRSAHQLLAGEEAHTVMPILWRNGDDLSFRFLRFQVDESALTRRQRQAFDALERILRQPELSFTHALARGEMCLVNNNWVLHKRKRYQNAESPRHHLRLWLARNNNRLRKEGGPTWQRAHSPGLSVT